jgi:hypothetical protein
MVRATSSGDASTHRPIGFRPPDPPLPLMRADAGDLARLCPYREHALITRQEMKPGR